MGTYASLAPGTPSKTRAVALHRAARRALAAAGRTDEELPHELWEGYLARCANVGSRMQAHNYNWLMERLGLIHWNKGKGGGIRILDVDAADVLMDEAPA